MATQCRGSGKKTATAMCNGGEREADAGNGVCQCFASPQGWLSRVNRLREFCSICSGVKSAWYWMGGCVVPGR